MPWPFDPDWSTVVASDRPQTQVNELVLVNSFLGRSAPGSEIPWIEEDGKRNSHKSLSWCHKCDITVMNKCFDKLTIYT